MESLGELLKPYAETIERDLERWLIEPGTPPELAEVMRYCVLDAGKRLRPALLIMVCEATGQDEIDELTARAGVAVESVHCYSLVHDDLPSMDDDELRRGRATAHVKFGEAMAILAGDALLTRAFGVLCEAPVSRDARVPALVAELSRASGPSGMVAGQVADMGLSRVSDAPEGLDYIHLHKTAALIRCAARMGAICSHANEQVLSSVTKYAESLGLAYQVIDDILDVTAPAETLGKTPGKDQAAGKRTYPEEVGLERARDHARELTARASGAIEHFGERGAKLRTLVELLIERTC